MEKLNIKNLEAAKELVKRYNSITLEEINSEDKIISMFLKQKLIGFGNTVTCKLCQYEWQCLNCIYVKTTNYECNDGFNQDTYYQIKDAKTDLELFEAYKNRARHLQHLIDMAEAVNTIDECLNK